MMWRPLERGGFDLGAGMNYTDITQEVIKDFRTFLPAFSDLSKWPESAVRTQIEEADAMTGGSCWGTYVAGSYRSLKRRGMFYLAAHYLSSFYGKDGSEIANVRPDARLNVSSKQVGDMSVTYRISEMEPTVTDFLSTTLYGTKYLELRRLVAMRVVAV